MESFHSVVIIGAGAAGLYAAQLLKPAFPDVLIVEAQDRVGGRIKQVHGLTPWAVQAGPEFVHGSNSVLVDVLREAGFQFQERPWPDWWFFGKEGRLVNDEEVDEEVDKVHHLFENCGEEAHPPPGKDVSALEWMKSQGATERMLAVADACYANDFACSLSQMGLREMVEENRRWDSGETYLIPDRSFSHLVEALSRGLSIRTNYPVERLEYGGPEGGVRLHCSGGRSIRAKRVLVTVPLKVLQDNVLNFSPPLPAPKLAAIHRVKMGNAVKIFLTFKRRFWPETMYDIVCPDSFVPEFWMLTYPHTAPGQGHPYLITGFLAGESADAVARMPEQTAVTAFLKQLDTIFASKEDPTPATSALASSQICDWSKEHYVRGAYTYPTLGAELGDRELLAAPVQGTVFFAGEATSLALNPCIQGALETGQRAATQIKASLDPLPSSRL